MQRNFTISTPAQTVRADADGRAEVVFTVANATQGPIGGIAKLVPLGTMRAEWLVLAGPEVREFPAGALHQFSVAVNLPPDAAEGRHQFRLDVADMRKNSEDRAESPVVTVEALARAAAAKPSRSWIPIAALAALILLAGVGYLLFRPVAPEEKPVEATNTMPATVGKKEAVPATDTVADVAEAKMVEVPDVISVPVAKAEWALEAAGLKATRKEVVDRAATAGTVRMSSPRPGEKVPAGSPVQLEVVIAPDLVAVPSVEGATWDVAKKAIEAASLVPIIDSIEPLRPMFDSRPSGTVTAQLTPAGTEVKRGSSVHVRLYGNPQ